ncbi:hypothetical protein D3C86_768860 [compost metagenome]
MTPVAPPTAKHGMNPRVHSIGCEMVIRPRNIVNSQLKILTPVGIPITIVEMAKNTLTFALAPIVKK